MLSERTALMATGSNDYFRPAEGVATWSKPKPVQVKTANDLETDKKITANMKRYSETNDVLGEVEKDLSDCNCCVIS